MWKGKRWVMSLVLVGTALCTQAREVSYTNEQIANAIYKAENSKKYPYGIKSINTNGNEVYARKICLNTIRNHRVRHAKHNCAFTFIVCLGNRYCPPTIHKLNRHWVTNVMYFLNKGGE